MIEQRGPPSLRRWRLGAFAAPYVVDGDAMRCGFIRLRLLGIDLPELAGHCPRYRECAPGDGLSSKRSLIETLRNGRVRDSIVMTDRFRRYVVIAWAGRVNLSAGRVTEAEGFRAAQSRYEAAQVLWQFEIVRQSIPTGTPLTRRTLLVALLSGRPSVPYAYVHQQRSSPTFPPGPYGLRAFGECKLTYLEAS